jgi:hypothetical protein
MARAKQLVFWGLAALMTAPVLFYTTVRGFNAATMWWKTGWESRPFIYISASGILVYVLYVAATVAALGWFWKITKDQFVGVCAVFLAVTLALYWLGFLTWSFAVLPTR